MLPEEIKPAMLGAIPSTMVTCSLAGVPNVTAISQVWYVDETHVALSFQFFSKTHRNVRENPFAEVIVRDGQNFQEWYIADSIRPFGGERPNIRRDGRRA